MKNSTSSLFPIHQNYVLTQEQVQQLPLLEDRLPGHRKKRLLLAGLCALVGVAFFIRQVLAWRSGANLGLPEILLVFGPFFAAILLLRYPHLKGSVQPSMEGEATWEAYQVHIQEGNAKTSLAYEDLQVGESGEFFLLAQNGHPILIPKDTLIPEEIDAISQQLSQQAERYVRW